MTLNLHTCNYMYTLSSFEAYETFPVEITRAHARKHLTRARARCASKDRRARETREQRQTRARGARASRASTARARRAYLRARRAYVSLFARARACPKCARLSLLAHLARAHVLNARALALRTPQLVRHHIWTHMFWIKPMYTCHTSMTGTCLPYGYMIISTTTVNDRIWSYLYVIIYLCVLGTIIC